jgi:Leucine-rich repeat (LRR) protein
MDDPNPQLPILDRIAHLFTSQGDALFTGSSTLCLPSPVLTYILQKPKSFEHAQVQEYLSKVIALKVVDDQNIPLKQSLNLAVCKSLLTLELKRIPLRRIKGLQYLREQLKTVVVQRCLNDIKDLLIPRGGDGSHANNWINLTQLNLSHNSITTIDSALMCLPSLKVLDLSHNCLSDDHQGLSNLTQLEELFIGHNQLLEIPRLFQNTHLTVVILCYNRIESLQGLEALKRLRTLDLQYNCISKGSAIVPLISLHSLAELNLEGNPIAYHPKYQHMVVNSISTLVEPSQFKLDGVPLTSGQKKILRLRPSIASMLPTHPQVTVTTKSKPKHDVALGYHSADDTPTSELEISGVWAMSESLNTPKLRKKRARAVNISDEEEQLNVSGSLLESLNTHEAQRNKDRREMYNEDWLQTMPDTGMHRRRNHQSTEKSSEPAEGLVSGDLPIEESDESNSEEDALPLGESFIVEIYESDTDDDMPKEDKRMFVTINERFLVERTNNAKVLRQLDLHCLMKVESEGDCLKLSFDYARRDFRKVVYSTTDAKKLTDILQPIAIRNQQNMVISPRYECLKCHGTFLKTEAVVIEDPSRYVSSELHTQRYQCPLCCSSYYGEHETTSTTTYGNPYPVILSAVPQSQEQPPLDVATLGGEDKKEKSLIIEDENVVYV